MPLVIRCIFIALCLSSWTASANPALYQHTQAVGQAMSALYMQGLSEGNVKYERDLERYKQLASKSLASYSQSNPEKSADLLKTWDSLKDIIKTTYTEEFGWDIDASIRRDFRGYLSTLYQLSLAEIKQNNSGAGQQQFALVQMESIIARFFDISSVYNGTYSLNASDAEKINPKVISQEFKQSMDQLMSRSTDETKIRQLTSAKYKWEFIEESVINNSDQSAFFLVYATKNKIKKVLESGPEQLSASGF